MARDESHGDFLDVTISECEDADDAAALRRLKQSRSMTSQLCLKCLDFLRLVLKRLSCPNEFSKSSTLTFRDTCSAFILWIDSYDITLGGLDAAISRSRPLERLTFKLLRRIVRCLTNDLVPLLDLSGKRQIPWLTSALLSETSKLNRLALDGNNIRHGRVGDYGDGDDTNTDTDSDSDNENEIVRPDKIFEDVIRDFKNHVQCLVDLAPLIQSPGKTQKRPPSAPPRVLESMNQAASKRLLYRLTSHLLWRHSSPSLGAGIVDRLTQANLQRFSKVHGLVPNGSSITTETSKGKDVSGAVVNPSAFDPEALRVSFYGEDMGPNVTIPLPKLPDQVAAGLPFVCIACGQLLFITTRAGWKKHLTHDLRPWMCLEPGCLHGDAPFATKMKWTAHLTKKHQFTEKWGQYSCVFCSESKWKGMDDLFRHLAYHLEQIALTALPASTVPEEPASEGDDEKMSPHTGISLSSSGSESELMLGIQVHGQRASDDVSSKQEVSNLPHSMPEPSFNIAVFKNSHFNKAHYNNPHFHPEEWTPADKTVDREKYEPWTPKEDTMGSEHDEVMQEFLHRTVSRKHFDRLFLPPTQTVVHKENDGAAPVAFQLVSPPRLAGRDVELDCYTWEFDGSLYQEHRTLVVRWPEGTEGPIPAKQLLTYPLAHDHEMIELLMERGQSFWQCRRRELLEYSVPGTARDIRPTTNNRYMVDVAAYYDLCGDTKRDLQGVKVVLEADKLKADRPPDEWTAVCLPAEVHAFGLHDKKWTKLPVENLHPPFWNTSAYQRLILDPHKKQAIAAITQSQQSPSSSASERKTTLILLHGPTGTGKTLTAETFAEHLKMPLYRITSTDLGTEPSDVDKCLKSATHLCQLWNAALLLDGCDIFLEQPKEADIQHSSLVSAMLNVLEQHRGIVFLTSSRVKTMEERFASRIQLAVLYPVLDSHSRRQIWENLFQDMTREQRPQQIEQVQQASGENSTDDVSSELGEISYEELNELAEESLNGWQIQHAVTTARQFARFEHEPLSAAHIRQAIKMAMPFNDLLATTHGRPTPSESRRNIREGSVEIKQEAPERPLLQGRTYTSNQEEKRPEVLPSSRSSLSPHVIEL